MIESMQDVSFLLMTVVFLTIMLDYLDLVPAAPLISASMEVSGIFIPLNSRSDFTPFVSRMLTWYV
jgi:hypothetical protein